MDLIAVKSHRFLARIDHHRRRYCPATSQVRHQSIVITDAQNTESGRPEKHLHKEKTRLNLNLQDLSAKQDQSPEQQRQGKFRLYGIKLPYRGREFDGVWRHKDPA